MIRDVRLDGWTPNDIPWKFEAGTPPIAEAIGLGRRDRLPRRARHGRRARARGALTGSALRTLTDASATPSPSTARRGPRSGAGCCRSPRRHPPARHLPGPRPAGRVRPGRPPLRQAAHAQARRRRHRPASLYVYNDTDDVDALADALGEAAEFFSFPTPESHDARSRRPLPRDHPRPLPQPAEPGRARRAAGPPGRGLQPAVRRRDRRLPRRRRRRTISDIRITGQGCSISQSSASMMSAAVKGKSVDEARAVTRASRR